MAESRQPIRHGPYPELTWTALLVGYVIGSLICLTIAYASLKLGFSIEGSELAAILGWGVLRGVMKRTSIVENNINQTIASSVNGASAGMMFSIPALFIMHRQNPELYGGLTDFNPYVMVLACITGGVLGLAFVIPLRKQMIDFNRLAYPGGIATAAILKSPGAGMRKAVVMLVAAGIAALATVSFNIAGLHDLELGRALGTHPMLNLTFYVSMLTIGAGFLAGRGGFLFSVGGFLCYWLLAPLLAGFGSEEVKAMVDASSYPDAYAALPGALRGSLFRPTGIGVLIGAAIGGIVAAFPLIRSAIRSMQKASVHTEDGAGEDVATAEMPIKALYVGVGLGAVALAALAWTVGQDLGIVRAIGMAVLGTLWVWVAGVIISECLGRTNWSPISGMTLIAVTILLFVGGTGGESDPARSRTLIITAVTVGAAICVAMAQAGDMMLDLKSGYLVGASPKKQQIGQLLATWLGPILVMVLIYALHEQHGLGSEKLPAPQGQALAGMIDGIVGGDVPAHRYGAGAVMGLIMAFCGLGGIGVLIGLGFYMPFAIVLTYTIGTILRLAADRFGGRRFVEDVGIPAAAGLIIGDGLVGVIDAMMKLFGGGA